MDYDTFIETEAEKAGITREQAESIARATLRTLADRITGGEFDDLTAQLPRPLKEVVPTPREEAEGFDVDEFIRRVAERANVDPETARLGAQAVLTTVRKAVTPGESDDVTSQLSRDYRELVGPMP